MNRETQKLLKRIAKEVGFRADKTTVLDDFEPTITIRDFRRVLNPSNPEPRDNRFADVDNPKRDGGSELSYRFNELHDAGLIEVYFSRGEGENSKQYIPGLRLTYEGVHWVREWQRSWLSKAIETQPITFLQVVVTVLLAIWTAYLAYRTASGK